MDLGTPVHSAPRPEPAAAAEPRVRRRKAAPATSFAELVEKTSSLSIREPPRRRRAPRWTRAVAPLVLTAVAAAVRLHGIGNNQKVVWDEAHFGKFGSYYLQHEFYFDVHPPLGKLLVGLSGWMAGFDGAFKFESGTPFPPGRWFLGMRVFNCLFGVACTPMAYWTALELGLAPCTAALVALCVALEMLSLTLAKFILLDSMLLCFTVSTFLCLAKLHRRRHALLTARGVAWLAATGVSIGCVCSVKWVGLFVTALVGAYTVYDLLVKYYQPAMSRRRYAAHWAARVATLIVVPFVIYVLAFKVHFAMLSRSGPGDGSISTLLQASLEGNTLTNGPRSLAYGSLVTLRSQGLSPNLLHSHAHQYPEGSRQQQVTTYGFKDENNEFLVEFDTATSRDEHRFATLAHDDENPQNVIDYHTLVRDGDTLRLSHKQTGCFLHSHAITAAVSSSHYEVSCYGGLDLEDEKDDWVVEISKQDVSPAPDFQNEPADEVHPVSTNFRLRHKALGCYLATSGYAYPSWGFQQGEVICKYSVFSQDKSTWWNVEDHVNAELESPAQKYVPPRPKFWKEFVLLNYGMMASNNALVPDPDHFDALASSWWEWPILRSGLRMGQWSPDEYKYFLIGHPFVTYLSTASLVLGPATLMGIFALWQRQKIDLGVFSEEWGFVLAAGILPLLGWVLHYLPFVMMARVTYLHHYVPALYFAIFETGFLVEYFIERRANKWVKVGAFGLLYACVVGVFWYYSPLAFGMVGRPAEYQHLRLLKSWRI